MRILDGANNPVMEFPVALATGILIPGKIASTLNGNAWQMGNGTDAARWAGGGTGPGLQLFVAQLTGQGGNIYFGDNVPDAHFAFAISAPAGANVVNYLQAAGGLTGAAVVLSAQGTDANIDIRETPKGTGVMDWNYATVALGGGAAPTLGTIGGSGPAAAAQFGWGKMKYQGVVTFFPVWR
jgi:hypothetical protein